MYQIVFINYLIIINIISFIICYLDKRLAINNKRRIKESTLLLSCLLGGVPLFTIAMYLFHHKTKKLKFKVVYIINVLWLYIIYRLIILI